MEKLATLKNERNYEIQDYMSIGYVFLLILGVVNQAIYYGLIGINIFEYTSVLDVLLSPVAVISDHWVKAVIIFVLIPLMIVYFKLMRKYYINLSKKEKYQTGKNKEKLDKILHSFNRKNSILPFILLMVVSMFLGFGIGGGYKTKEKINNLDYKYTHELIFEDGEAKKVRIVGKNSLYVFYATKDEKTVLISPIEGNIKTIKKLIKE